MAETRFTDEQIQEAIETRFECARCGHCCKGSGTVDVGEAEIWRMAEHLALEPKEFIRRYAIAQGRGRWILRDIANEEQWCIFLELMPDGLYGCKVNAAKPDQCASFPARWRNTDSLQTCMGLRLMLRDMRREAQGRG